MTIIQIDRPAAKAALPGLAPFLVALAYYVDFVVTPPYHRSGIRTLDKWIETRARIPGSVTRRAVTAPGATLAALGRALHSEAA